MSAFPKFAQEFERAIGASLAKRERQSPSHET